MSRKSGARKLSKYEWVILKSVWSLDPEYSRLLDSKKLYLSSPSQFLLLFKPSSSSTQQKTAGRISIQGKSYVVDFLGISQKDIHTNQFVSGYEVSSTTSLLALQLRTNIISKFYSCLVRTWDKNWTEEYLTTKLGATWL